MLKINYQNDETGETAAANSFFLKPIWNRKKKEKKIKNLLRHYGLIHPITHKLTYTTHKRDKKMTEVVQNWSIFNIFYSKRLESHQITHKNKNINYIRHKKNKQKLFGDDQKSQ